MPSRVLRVRVEGLRKGETTTETAGKGKLKRLITLKDHRINDMPHAAGLPCSGLLNSEK